MDNFLGHKIIIIEKLNFYVKILLMVNKPAVSQNFAHEIVEELKKVSWPTRKGTIRLTSIVIGISLIIGIYIGIIDVLLAKGLDFITKFR